MRRFPPDLPPPYSNPRAWVSILVVAALAACAAIPSRPLPPKVEVQGIRVVVAPTGEPRFRVLLDVRNPNPYDIAIATIEARIRLEDQDVAAAGLPAPVTLAGAGETQVEIEARPDFAALRTAVDRMLRKLAGHYEVMGYAIVQDGIRLDFRREGDLPLASLLGRMR